ncbi:MAG TPA: hypothetical protein VNN22_02515 [Verrucomicrobiae bacterium]|nr:hypothetical protein [Verrucomicrobiae bacterium]
MVASIHLVETMSGLIAVILASARCGLGAIIAEQRRDFSDLYVFLASAKSVLQGALHLF